MAKKKTEDFEVDMMTTEVNDEEKKEVELSDLHQSRIDALDGTAEAIRKIKNGNNSRVQLMERLAPVQ